MHSIKTFAIVAVLACLTGCASLPGFATQVASAPYVAGVAALCQSAAQAVSAAITQAGPSAAQVQQQIATLTAAAAPVCARPAPPVATPAQIAALTQALTAQAVQNAAAGQ